MVRLTLSAGLLAALLLASAHSLPPRRSRADTDDFVAAGTNELATTMLQHYVDVDANIAFSPLGVSALLAILAEGARGETRDQLVAALHLPADREKIRDAYKTVLSRLKEKHTLNHPEFRNWFYIYKNYTVEQCFRDVLEDTYLTEVRDVDNPNRDEITEASSESSTETIVIHKPIKFEHTGVKVELPEIKPEEPETTSADNELEKVDVDGAKADHPVKGEGLDPDNLPVNLHPMSQVPINPFTEMDQDDKDVNVIKPPFKPSQEDSIRTIMVQEAVVMQEVLTENEKIKTMELIKEREEEMKEALEKDVLDKEQMKVEMEQQMETEKEIQNILEDKIKNQEEIKEALESNMNKEEQAIEALKEDVVKLEDDKEATAEVMNENMGVIPNMINGGQIKVAVVIMNDDEMKQDIEASENKVPVKEEFVDNDKVEKIQPSPSESINNVADPLIEAPDKSKNEYLPEEATPEAPVEAKPTLPFVDVSLTDQPKHPHNHTHNHDHDHTHPVKEDEEKAPMISEVTEEPIKMEAEASTPGEAMIAMERKTRSAEEITSSFSGNNLVKKGSAPNKQTSMMIAFNALYFKGSWKTPFVTQPSDRVHSFYISDTEKVPVPMMHTEGSFKIGKISELDSVAIDLPYEGGRYSLLVILPNSRGGLKKLIADLSGYSLCDLSRSLTSQQVEVCLPSFEIQTTTKPIRALSKFGVSNVFNQESADLSGISPDHGLFVQDMSQLVTLNVDLTSSSTNFLTASSEAAMMRGDDDKLVADHPFLYFVHDVIDNIIVVAGKVTNPAIIPDDMKTEV